jgi:hypothetical protein
LTVQTSSVIAANKKLYPMLQKMIGRYFKESAGT